MSTVDHIFLRTGLPPAEAAQRIADTLGMSVAERRGRTIVSAELPDQPGVVGGDVDVNVYGNDPEERSVLDGYDTAWAIRSTVNDEALVHREAKAIFHRLTDKLPWPALLVRNHAWLVSAWHPQHGRRDLPEGVTPEAKDEQYWAPYALPPA